MYYENKKYNEAWRQWVADTEWDYFVTLAFNPQSTLSRNSHHFQNRIWSIEDAARDLHAWHARIDRKMLGNNWQNKPLERTQFIAFVEHPESNIHWHLMVKINSGRDDTFRAEAERIWEKLISSGTMDIKPAIDADANLTFSRYCGKAIYLYDPSEHIQFSQY